MSIALSILDLAFVADSSTAAATFQASVLTAQTAERLGYRRYWFSEHHNMPSIASSAPAVLVAHIASHTKHIRVGSGGIMLPNHSPLVIAEQFGTLEALYPGRIDLGVGRAPGGDASTFSALRRDPSAAEHFPQDVMELQALLGPSQAGQAVQAIPGTGLNVPIYILGSSLFGARLAAILGLPYAFASHFAPDALETALEVYREEFRPSAALSKPYVIAGLNVMAADSTAAAETLYVDTLRRISQSLMKRMGTPMPTMSDELLFASPAGRQARHMLSYVVTGNRDQVRRGVKGFVQMTAADEVMVVCNVVDTAARLHSFEILAEAMSGEMIGEAGAKREQSQALYL